MNLEHLLIEPRVRTPWEAIDLGIKLTLLWWWPLYLSWAIPAGCTFFILWMVLPNQPWLAYLVCWWLKPLWDRFPLFVASRALFSENIRLKTLFKQSFTLLKTDALAWCFWRRLNINRSFDLPLTVLEKSQGDFRRLRLQALHRANASAALWLTLCCATFEWVIVVALIIFAQFFVPQGIEFNFWNLLASNSTTTQYLGLFLFFIAMTLVAPFYVVAGFTLYISRRIELEGWDIELRFKRMVARLTQSTLMLIGLVFCVHASLPNIALAADAGGVAAHEATKELQYLPASTDARQQALMVFNQADFYREHTGRYLRFKQKNKTENAESWLEVLLRPWLDVLGGNKNNDEPKMTAETLYWIAQVLRVMLIGICVFLVAYCIYRVLPYRPNKLISPKSPKKNLPQAPSELFGLDVTAKSLPPNVMASARELVVAEEFRQALSLLFRATLMQLLLKQSAIVSDAQTELECEASIAKSDASGLVKQYFADLTQAWLLMAYAHEPPNTAIALALCDRWQQCFGESL